MYIILAAVAVFALAATFTIRQLLSPPRTPPDFTGPRPEIAENGYITHSEEIIIDMPLDQYLAWVETQPLEAGLTGQDDIPSVARTEIIQGTWHEVGARRMIVLSDGHYVAEEVLAENPNLFRYQVWGYTNYARFATDYAIGEFQREEVDGKTHIKWTYSYHKRSNLTGRFLESFVENSWGPYMRQYLQISKEQSEKDLKGA
ncbi:hypothetical protein [Paenibacillus beijingensis]|uniref:SRPBCC family protein n=1 Tax=Paenibacillus beijingensis TaxID=1126833 RepID=A0A0D5NDX7_9BACL|nr:hypothetical protein [Paenibacillus beijingensis]AJY73451.1 hypothetical protein VN24_00940 [Paenibacillus beijingensis]